MPDQSRILLIEDDIALLKIYSNKLRVSGFEVSMATTGDEGLRKAHAEKPDLILLDLILPGQNGFTVLETLKSDEKTMATPVIIMSNLGQESDRQRCRDLGAADYLVKSDASLMDVVATVKKHLAH